MTTQNTIDALHIIAKQAARDRRHKTPIFNGKRDVNVRQWARDAVAKRREG